MNLLNSVDLFINLFYKFHNCIVPNENRNPLCRKCHRLAVAKANHCYRFSYSRARPFLIRKEYFMELHGQCVNIISVVISSHSLIRGRKYGKSQWRVLVRHQQATDKHKRKEESEIDEFIVLRQRTKYFLQ